MIPTNFERFYKCDFEQFNETWKEKKDTVKLRYNEQLGIGQFCSFQLVFVITELIFIVK
jgi:hypothetical protein